MKEFDFYKREQLRDDLWVVTESYGVNSCFRIFVIIGKEDVVIIDSGLGAQSGLRRYIGTFITGTDKKMHVLLTHTHPDHVGGAPLFENVYANPLEFPDLDWNRNHYRRFGDLERFCGHDRQVDDVDHDVMNFCYLHFVRELLQEEDIKAVNDGDVLTFGDITIECIHCPTHSAGSTCYLDRERNVCFVGDAIQCWNGFPGHEKGKEYAAAVDKLLSKLPEGVTVLNPHDEGVFDVSIVKNVRQCMQDLIEKKNLENDTDPVYSNHFHVRKKSTGTPAPRKMLDHYVDNVRLGYNSLDF